MASLNSYHYSTTTSFIITLLIIVLLLHHLLPLVSCFNKLQPSIPPRELLFEEKNRLGSLPPSCHSKCNECHPCMAVQVPSLPSQDSVPSKVASMKKWLSPSLQVGSNRYSNYKPLGWKCHCGDHFFNP